MRQDYKLFRLCRRCYPGGGGAVRERRYERRVEKVKGYARNGVPNIWLIDPHLQLLYTYCPPALIEIEGESISTTDHSVEVSRNEIFAE